MSELARLQGDFQDYLLSGDASTAVPHVLGTARVPVGTRLAIYGGAYVSRLIDALASNYPALAALMGAEDFRALGEDYVRAHQSVHFSIRFYGEALAEFLAAHATYAEVPVLPELARWEWAMRAVFDAADAPSLTHRDFEQVRPEQWAWLRFAWHPSVTRLDLHWNAPQLWRALTDEAPQPAVEYQALPAPWLLWRQGLTTYFRSVPAGEQGALDAARQGWPFGELCELLCAEAGAEAAPAQAAALLRGWVEAGLITAISTAT
jgi:Putative DNA-binding domain